MDEEAAHEAAQVDTTTGGNHGHAIHSEDWHIVAEDPSDEELRKIGHERNPPIKEIVAARKRAESVLAARKHARMRRCSTGCPGWGIFEVERGRGLEVQACDECNQLARAKGLPELADADARMLHEVQRAVRAHQQPEGIGRGMGRGVQEDPPLTGPHFDFGRWRGNPHRWPSSETQSLLFDTREYTEAQAKAWAKEHGYHHSQVDTTAHYHRLRQEAPTGGPCRTIELGKGIKAIVCSAGAHGKPPWIPNPGDRFKPGDRVEWVTWDGLLLKGTVRERGLLGTSSPWQGRYAVRADERPNVDIAVHERDLSLEGTKTRLT